MRVAIQDAALQLDELMRAAGRGEQVIITSAEGAVLLSPVPANEVATIPTAGFAKGSFQIADDFDAPLDDFAPYMP